MRPAKTGEWLAIKDSDADDFEAAFGVAARVEAIETLKGLTKYALNALLKVRHERDVVLVARQSGGALRIGFDLVLRENDTTRRRPAKAPRTPRSALPAADVRADVNLTLNFEPPKVAVPLGRVQLEDGSTVPDLSALPFPDEIVAAGAEDLDGVDEALADFAEIFAAEDDVETMAASFRREALRRQPLPPQGATPVAVPTLEAQSWSAVSTQVVAETLDHVRSFRARDAKGQLLVLAPSPSTGKSHGMMKAAYEEQGAGRAVGYAVLGREQIQEAADRLRGSGPNVRLFVITGRDDKNCDYMEQVTVATDAGFSPGSTVCPSCPRYPFNFMSNPCGYYKSRQDAWNDRKRRDSGGALGSAIILTTHASAILGSHIVKRRLQGFWRFDTLFIDEDPMGSMVTQHEIREDSLTFTQRDANGNFDPATLGTTALRLAMEAARKERAVASTRGFVNALGDSDRIHSRNHGSSYAGGDLQALLSPHARAYGHTLAGLATTVVDGASVAERPPKGEIMGMDATAVAVKYPNRYLAPFFQALDVEMKVADELKLLSPGLSIEPAYRTHIDLSTDEDGETVAVARVHELKGYGNPETNIVIGDAYANVETYEWLFERFAKDGNLTVVKHRAVWPATSKLIRCQVRAGVRDLGNEIQTRDFLDAHVRPVLEMERRRRIVFYIHKSLKGRLREWLEKNALDLDLGDFAIEHWGSGRGKDAYRSFDTFIGVSEYVPNVGALIHEANTIAAVTAPVGGGNVRVAHWNSYAPRKGSARFINSVGGASPFYQAAFQRKATDELAQAVHRIRPAIPAEGGRQKHAYVFGCKVPWSDELVAATTGIVVADNGKAEVDLEVEPGDDLRKGGRFEITETLGLLSAREIAGAIATVYGTLGVWSHAFAHVLLAAPGWSAIEDSIRAYTDAQDRESQGMDDGRVAESLEKSPLRAIPLLYKEERLRPSARNSATEALVARVFSPPSGWRETVRRLSTARLYKAGFEEFLKSPGDKPQGTLRLPWMPSGSRGYAFWGDGSRFDQILNSEYAPGVEKVPF